jgi:hypothetical protein
MGNIKNKKIFLLYIVLLFNPYTILTNSQGLKQDQEIDKEIVVTALQYFESKIQNFQAKFKNTFEFVDPRYLAFMEAGSGTREESELTKSFSFNYIWENGKWRSEMTMFNMNGDILRETWQTLKDGTLMTLSPALDNVRANSVPSGSIMPQANTPIITNPNRFMLVDVRGEPLSLILRKEETKLYKEFLNSKETIVCEFYNKGGSKIKIYLDPNMNYSLMKKEIYTPKPEEKLYMTLDNIIWKDLGDDILFPLSAKSTIYHAAKGEIFKAQVLEMKVDEESVQVNQSLPENVFTIEFPEGTHVIDQIQNLRYVVGPSGPKLSVSLIGKSMPDFNDVGIKLQADIIKDKIILVCFFDMNQRPSRHCLQQLSERAQELKKKDIVVVAVQASKIDENTLRKWTKDQSVSFPVGIAEGDEEETRFAWGVLSLPWLILTDKEHVVRAEGFNVNELDEKITALKEK